MPFIILNIVLALIPSLVLLIIFYRQDNLKPEPKGQVLKLFFLGCLSTIPAIVAELMVGLIQPWVPVGAYHIFQAFAVAALCEESIKLGTVTLFTRQVKAFDEVMDGIVYTIAAGLGFAFLENILYSLGSAHFITVLVIRGVTSVPLHAVCSGILGFSIGIARMKKTPGHPLKGWVLAILIHGLYDYFIFTGKIGLIFLIIPLLIGSYIYLFSLIRKARQLDSEGGYI